MRQEGIVIGSDRNQEWLLPLWWERYSDHNAYPVAFADFGMSPESAAWCRERGELFSVPEIEIAEVPPNRREVWEAYYGNGILSHRKLFFKKPFALLQSPFLKSVWIDLDCRVRGSLAPLFALLDSGIDIGMRKEPEEIQRSHLEKGFILPGETDYNTGVIPCRKDAQILADWIDAIRTLGEEFPSDQQAFSRALKLRPAKMAELDPIYNWSPINGSNPNAVIYHFHGSFLKDPAIFYFFP